MIGEALIFLKHHLNERLTAQAGGAPSESLEDKVVFVDGERMDPITFKLGAITTLLINVEEEKVLRDADPYARVDASGAPLRTQPTLRLNLYVLFVARFKQYEHGLDYLGRIIQHFQSHKILDHQSAPALDDRIAKLIMELQTLAFSEQNEVWNALRTTYHPSVLYRVKLVAFSDPDAARVPVIRSGVAGVSP